jgi:hypothetical protein
MVFYGISGKMLHLVVTCVKDKIHAGPRVSDAAKELLRRGVRNDVGALFQSWTELVEARFAQGPRTTASGLYTGGLWSHYWRAFQRAPEPKCLWIISAGLGLLQDYDLVCGYGASFLPGVPDSVFVADYFTNLGREAVHREWWKQLTLWKPSRWAHPRSVQALQETLDDKDSVLVASGGQYLRALRDDLRHLTPDERVIFALSHSAASALPRSLQGSARVFPTANPRTAPGEALKQALNGA